jgi:hypothetical protein
MEMVLLAQDNSITHFGTIAKAAEAHHVLAIQDPG